MYRAKVVVLDQDDRTLDVLDRSLPRAGFDIYAVYDGEIGLSVVERVRPDLVILDVDVPSRDGFELCRSLKLNAMTRSIPVIILSARFDEGDVMLGLGLGADDYVPKPFRAPELIARMKAVLRRFGHDMGSDETRIRWGQVEIDAKRHEVLVKGKSVPFTVTEFRLLKHLASRQGTVVARDSLVSIALSKGLKERTIDVHIQSIRKKLGSERWMIATVRGVGYRALTEDESPVARGGESLRGAVTRSSARRSR